MPPALSCKILEERRAATARVVAEFQSSAQKRSSVRYGANGGTGPAFPDLLLAADDDKLLDFGGTDIDIDIDVDIEIDMDMD
eukprot:scaffold17615_cov131-Skeletonema_marinoi.AAC.3